MIKRTSVILAGAMMVSWVNLAEATPLDLNIFDTLGDVNIDVSAGVVTIDEVNGFWGSYFYDDDFLVDGDALYLSVDYALTSGPDDLDYVVSSVDWAYDLVEAGPTSGTYILELLSYRGSTISLEFGLEPDFDYDFDLGSIATFSNFDYVTVSNSQGTAPVPEPATILLFGAGLAGLAGISRRKRSKKPE